MDITKTYLIVLQRLEEKKDLAVCLKLVISEFSMCRLVASYSSPLMNSSESILLAALCFKLE